MQFPWQKIRKVSAVKIAFFLMTLFCAQARPAEDKVIFLHIPKTGGVSISALLMNEYTAEQAMGPNPLIYSYGFHWSLYEIARVLNIIDFKLITFLRNPIDRVLSEQSYCIGKHQGNSEILHSHRLPVIGAPIETARNIMCKMLSGLNDQDSNISIEEHLNCAKMNLAKNFFFVGITEKMDESIELLYTKLGWQLPKTVPCFNASNRAQQQYDSAEIDSIAERNWADIELYHYALSIYNDNKNKILSNPANSHRSKTCYDTLHYTFDQPMKGSGWGLREFLYDNTAYRWVCDNDEASIYFDLKAENDYLLQLDILIQPILVGQLIVKINDHPIHIHRSDVLNTYSGGLRWAHYSAKIPQTALVQGQETQCTLTLQRPEDPLLLAYYAMPHTHQHILDNYKKGKFACKMITIQTAPFKNQNEDEVNFGSEQLPELGSQKKNAKRHKKHKKRHY